MSSSTIDWNPTRRRLRYFAWLTALVLAALAGYQDVSPWIWTMRLAAALIFAIGTVMPGVLRWPYLAVLLTLRFVAWVFRRAMRAFYPYSVLRQHAGGGAERFHDHHGRQPATRIHG